MEKTATVYEPTAELSRKLLWAAQAYFSRPENRELSRKLAEIDRQEKLKQAAEEAEKE